MPLNGFIYCFYVTAGRPYWSGQILWDSTLLFQEICIIADHGSENDAIYLTLTSPIDINVPTRSALVLVTKDSFVPLVTNLNNKDKVCKQSISLFAETLL